MNHTCQNGPVASEHKHKSVHRRGTRSLGTCPSPAHPCACFSVSAALKGALNRRLSEDYHVTCSLLCLQAILISSGNLSFLNHLTILPAIFCLDDGVLRWAFCASTLKAVDALHPQNAVPACAGSSATGIGPCMNPGSASQRRPGEVLWPLTCNRHPIKHTCERRCFAPDCKHK